MSKTKNKKGSVEARFSHGVSLSASCGTGPRAFCAGDASPDAPASHERPAPLPGCAPVYRKSDGHWDALPPQFRIRIETEPYLFLHQILQMCDPLRILGVTADIVLIKEGL